MAAAATVIITVTASLFHKGFCFSFFSLQTSDAELTEVEAEEAVPFLLACRRLLVGCCLLHCLFGLLCGQHSLTQTHTHTHTVQPLNAFVHL